MKVIPFPGDEGPLEHGEIAALEGLITGQDQPAGEAWRELSSDIRALAPPIDRQFEVALYQRLSAAPDPSLPATSRSRPRRIWRWWRSRPLTPRLVSLGGAGALAALLIAVVIVGPLGGNSSRTILSPRDGSAQSGVSEAASAGGSASSAQGAKAYSEESKALPGVVEPTSSEKSKAVTPGVAAGAATPSPATRPNRVQQLGASLTLAGTPEEVQQLADGVSRVVIGEGGFVSSSQVQVERGGNNSATLAVSVPSSRLSRTLAALGRLGPVRAETQSLQDITSTYDAARSALQDAVAERAALLRALAHASTQGQIESLHRRLGIVGGAIERARDSFAHVSSRADNANLEVDVIGEAHPAGGALTLHRGLHDAGRVLTVALAVLLIGLAALLPLLAVGFALALTVRGLRRAARERALGR